MLGRHRLKAWLAALGLVVAAAALVAWQPWVATRPPAPVDAATGGVVLDPGAADMLLRLHVVAHSDAAADQEAKLRVRDAVMAALSAIPGLAGSGSADEAAALIAEHREILREAARRVLEELGSPYDVRVEVGPYPYPGRVYEGVWVPAGVYPSLRVVLGDGKGANWWCVLFPPACTVPPAASPEPVGGPVASAADQPGLSGAGERPAVSTATGNLEVRLALWEWLRRSWPQAWVAAPLPATGQPVP
ncbi:MAG TPA: stage II sporulation protein R [Bacillota bacterium]